MLRCWVTDFDVMSMRNDLIAMLWESVVYWPPYGEGIDAEIIPDEDGASGILNSESGNFNYTGEDNKPVPVGTIVNVAGMGFFTVDDVMSNTSLSIVATGNSSAFSAKIKSGENHRYMVGGWSNKLVHAYEVIWNNTGLMRVESFSDKPWEDVITDKPDSGYVSKAMYIPDNFHGADLTIKLGALKWILFSLVRNNNASARDIYDEVEKLYNEEFENVQYIFDFDSDGTNDTYSFNQTRLIR